MPTYEEIYMEDQGKRRHMPRFINGNHANGESKAMWIVIVGSLVFLWLVRRGFRGVSAGGLSLGVR